MKYDAPLMKKEISLSKQGESYKGFHLWLWLAVLILGAYSLNPEKIPGLGTAQVFCILAMGMIVILYIFVAFTGNVYWLPGITFDETSFAGVKNCRIYGVWNLLIYTITLIAYLLYCQQASKAVVSSSIYNAIAGAVIFCAAVFFSSWIPFAKSRLSGKSD